MNISLLPGHLLVAKDPDETGTQYIHFPDVEHVHACIGTVLMHERRSLEDLTGKRIVIQKWSERILELSGTKFWLIREAAVLMILEEE
jgi:ABC-type amino acid transport substrate-binding protein